MMKCMYVCHVFVYSQLSANDAKQDACQALSAIGQLWPSGDDDQNDCDEDGDELSALAVALSPTHDPTSVHHNVHHSVHHLCTMVVGGTAAWSGDIQRAKM